ncbi:MAG: ACT domain-containing protein, partial [Nitrospinaceae bacterium]
RKIAGSIFGKGDPRIIQLDEDRFEAVISKHMLILNNQDVPGVIGSLGGVLGENNINIAGFHLGRMASGDAVSVINIDSPPTAEALQQLRDTSYILEVYSVVL